MHAKAPKPDAAHELIDWLISKERGIQMIDEEGYGHSNARAMEAISDERLAGLGLSRDPAEVLGTGKFMIPQEHDFDSKSAELYEMIKAGF